MKTYSIEELELDAQEKAINRLLDMDIMTLTDWWEDVFNDIGESLGYLGMTNVEMDFSRDFKYFTFTADYDSSLADIDTLRSLKCDFHYDITHKAGLLHDVLEIPCDTRVQVKLKRDDSPEAQSKDLSNKDSYESITIDVDAGEDKLKALQEGVFEWLNTLHSVVENFALTDLRNEADYYQSGDGAIDYAMRNGYMYDADGNIA